MAATTPWQLVPPWIEQVLSGNEHLSFYLHQKQVEINHLTNGLKLAIGPTDQGQQTQGPTLGWGKKRSAPIHAQTQTTLATLEVAWKEEHVRLSARPALPSKAVVVQGASPLLILPEERIDVWIKLPLSLQLLAQRVHPIKCFDLYDFRPTWFGDGPHDGELCYLNPFAWSSVPAKGELDSAQVLVSLANQADDPIEINRIKIPCHQLSLFLHQEQGQFYSDALTLVKSELLEGQISTRFPFDQSQLLLVNPGKNLGRGKNILSRAFNGNWGE